MSEETVYGITEEKTLIETINNKLQLNIDSDFQIFIKDYLDTDDSTPQEFNINKPIGIALVRSKRNDNVKAYNKANVDLRVGFIEMNSSRGTVLNEWSIPLPVGPGNNYVQLNCGVNTTGLLFWARE